MTNYIIGGLGLIIVFLMWRKQRPYVEGSDAAHRQERLGAFFLKVGLLAIFVVPLLFLLIDTYGKEALLAMLLGIVIAVLLFVFAMLFFSDGPSDPIVNEPVIRQSVPVVGHRVVDMPVVVEPVLFGGGDDNKVTVEKWSRTRNRVHRPIVKQREEVKA